MVRITCEGSFQSNWTQIGIDELVRDPEDTPVGVLPPACPPDFVGPGTDSTIAQPRWIFGRRR
jgi:hypothetical protein